MTTSPSTRLHARGASYRSDSSLSTIERIFPDKNHAQVCDAGCGDGNASSTLVKQGHHVIGLDIHESALSEASKRGIDSRKTDLESHWPVESHSCDIVLLVDILEHLSDPLHALQEAHRILRSGGCVIVAFPNHFDIRSRVEILLGKGITHWSHRRYRTPAWKYPHVRFLILQELRGLLSRADFSIEAEQFNYMGGGLIPRRLLPQGVRRVLTARWPNLFSGKFVLRATKSSPAQKRTRVCRIIVPTTPDGF